MAQEKTLDDLFLDTLKDIYFAEKQIVKALPRMAKAAQSPQLRAGFEKHLEETEGQIDRLEQIFEIIGAPARGKTCEAIMGILDEGKEIMTDFKGTVALDAGLGEDRRQKGEPRSTQRCGKQQRLDDAPDVFIVDALNDGWIPHDRLPKKRRNA